MDLLRVALSYHRGSIKVAKRFSDEALKRCAEIKTSEVKPYFAKILAKIKTILSQGPQDRTAEDALMYSVLCKNYAQKYLS